MKTRLLVLSFLVFSPTSALAQTSFWEFVGGIGGLNSTTLCFDSSGAILVSGIPYISRSTDQGLSWDRIATGVAPTAMCLGSSGVLLGGSDNGIDRSTDGGLTWKPTQTTGMIKSIVRAPSGQLYAGGFGASILRSTNNGTSWVQVASGLTTSSFSSVVVHSNGSVFAGSMETGSGVFRTTDEGLSWSRKSAGLDDLGNLYVMDLIALSDGSLLVGTSFDGIFRSADLGEHWTRVKMGGAMAFAEGPSGTVYASTYSDETFVGGLVRSTDHGLTWTPIAWTGSRVNKLLVDVDGRVYASHTQGVAFSTDQGSSWRSSNTGSRYHAVNAMHVRPDGTVLAAGDDFGFVDAGLHRSTDQGLTWSRFYVVPTSSYASDIAETPGGILYHSTFTASGTVDGGLYRSTDGGTSWTRRIRMEVFRVRTTSDGSLLVCGQDGFARISASDSAHVDPMRHFAYDAVEGANGSILAGFNADDGILMHHTETGVGWNWSPRAAGLPFESVGALVRTPSGALLAGTSNSGIFRSTDEGFSWLPTSGSTGYIRALAVIPGGKIFASNNEGAVVESVNDGSTWVDRSSGLPGTGVLSLAMLPDGRLLAGTSETGIYRSTRTVLGVKPGESQPREYALLTNFPNPFNPGTWIRFELPSRCRVTLEIFNALGQLVEVVMDEEAGPGSFERSWIPRGASGVYLCRLKASNVNDATRTHVVARRLVYVR